MSIVERDADEAIAELADRVHHGDTCLVDYSGARKVDL